MEKTHQVRLMSEIYRRAEQVIIWLGPTKDAWDQVMNLLREVGQAARNWGLESYFTRERRHLLGAMSRNENPEDRTTRELQELMRNTASGVTPLLAAMVKWVRRSWFHRI